MERTSAALRIGELSQRTGVGVPTLRAWESRYRLLLPSRTAGGQRLYSAEDEARVREVQRLAGEGVAVGAAARWVAENGLGTVPMTSTAGARLARAGTGRGVAVATITKAPLLSADFAEAEFLAVVHDTTRALIHASSPADVVSVLAGFVRRIGGSVVGAQIDDAVLPVDLSFGEGPPMLPRAESMSVARLALELALPALVEDARRLIDLLRRTESRPPAT